MRHWLRRMLHIARGRDDEKLEDLHTELQQERQLSRLVKAEYQERVVRGVLSELRKTH